MRKLISKYSGFFLIITLSLALFYCCERDQEWDLIANQELIKVMKSNYLWYDQMPDVNASDYANPEELIEALRVNPPDRWSYVTTKQEFDAYYNSGAYYGFGFGNVFDENGVLYVLYVFKNSPLFADKVQRGWVIDKIDGVIPTPSNFGDLIGPNEAGITKTFDFITPTGTKISHSYTKAEVSMNTVLFDSTYTFGQTKVGYMVLKSFIEPTIVEINDCFSRFKAEGVSELIIDLRYNGGGITDVSNNLASLIGGTKTTGKVFATYIHNDKKAYKNGSVYFKSMTNSLSINRVLFITTGNTASASELVINSLKPFMPLTLVGSTTHGKPAGMYSFIYNEFDWAFVPICFTLRNANNEGDYYDGIPVSIAADDDITRRFGDVNEVSFQACLQYLGVSTKGEAVSSIKLKRQNTGTGLYEEIGSW